jgi:hypothetical protein
MQVVGAARPGGRYVVSAYVRVEDVRDGAGAYIGMNYFGADGVRISWTDSETKLTGTRDWVRITQRFEVPPGAARVDLDLCLHGHGTAYFDRTMVEAGDTVSEWTPREGPPSGQPGTVGGGRVAIFRDDIPATGTASDPEVLRDYATRAGFACSLVTADELADPDTFTRVRFDVLVLPYGSSFPAAAADNVLNFCREDGGLLTVGGYPFDKLLARQNGGWVDVADLTPDEASLVPIAALDPKADGWVVGGREVQTAPAPVVGTDKGPAVVLDTPALSGWVTVSSPPIAGLPADSLLTAFYARSEADGMWLSFEWGEADGSRWRSKVRLTREWRLYAIPHSSLEYWHDNPSKGRGGDGDHFRKENAVCARFGLTGEFLQEGKPYSATIAAIRSGREPLPDYRNLQLNSHHGTSNPATFLETSPACLSICDASAPLTDVAALVPSGEQCVVPESYRVTGTAAGFSATGQTAQGSAGTPLKARWIPLVDAVDRYGRLRGTALGAMHNFAGEFPGSTWIYSGISSRDLFPRDDKQAEELLGAVLRRMTAGAFLFDATTAQRSLRPGEEAAPEVKVANLAASEAEVTLRLTVTVGGREVHAESASVRMPARCAVTQHLKWTVPAEVDEDVAVFTFEVERDGRAIDKLSCGATLFTDALLARGPRLTYRDDYFALGDGAPPSFLLGSQIYWGNSTNTGTDPLRWDRQLQVMADSGIRIARSFMWTPWMSGTSEEATWRPRDAMVQLAQRHGIALFYSGVSWPTTDPALARERAKMAAEASARYRAAPGWFIDIVNEPSMPVGGADADHAQFREWLKRRYGSTEALRAAWGEELVEAALDDVRATPARGPWASRRASDTLRFYSDAMREWTRVTAEASRGADPTRLVSVGHLQGFGDQATTWDPINASLDMDFANRHYYGDIRQFGPELKQTDMRTLGKAPSTGEFGATSHPGLESHGVYEPESVAVSRYSYVVHTAFGLGGAFVANWHWQDPIEDIFPCGLFLADGAPRPRFPTYRNLGLLFGRFQPRYDPPEVFFVIPSSHRLGTSALKVEAAMNRSLAALIELHVDFGTVSEETLDSLPPTAKALVWPVPFCPGDTIFDRVLAFAKRGGHVYVSGDVSYGEERRRDRTERLETLCGARFVAERYPNIERPIAPGARGVEPPDTLLGRALASSGADRPCIQVEPTTARVVARAGGVPVALDNTVGSGRVLFVTDPVELSAQPTDMLRVFLDSAGVKRHAMEADLPAVHSHRVAGRDGAVAHVLFNTGEATATVTVSGLPRPVRITLAPASGGAVVFGSTGELVAAEGVVIEVAGETVLDAEGTQAVVWLAPPDGVALLPLSEGRVRIAGTAGLTASIGEVHNGAWTEYERRAVSVEPLVLDGAIARSLIVLGRAEALPDLCRQVLPGR